MSLTRSFVGRCGNTRRPLEDRFLEKFEASDNECWNWIGCRGKSGYGAITNELGKVDGAHRISYRMFRGPIPEGATVLHSCDNRACVNPSHLRTGTAMDNATDCVSRGRARGGVPRGKWLGRGKNRRPK